jgi:hypothetical protein
MMGEEVSTTQVTEQGLLGDRLYACRADEQFRQVSASNSALASCKSLVSNPSVNQL